MVKELVFSVSRRITPITWNNNLLQTNHILYGNSSWIFQSWCYSFSEIWYPFVFISVSAETNLHRDIIHDTCELQNKTFLHSMVFRFVTMQSLISRFIHLVVCLMKVPKHLPKPSLQMVRSTASSFKWEYPLLSLRSSSSYQLRPTLK